MQRYRDVFYSIISCTVPSFPPGTLVGKKNESYIKKSSYPLNRLYKTAVKLVQCLLGHQNDDVIPDFIYKTPT